MCGVSPGQPQASTFYNDREPIVSPFMFHNECKGIVADFNGTQDAIDFCSCIRTANHAPTVNTVRPAEYGPLFTAIIHTMLPLSNPPVFPAGEQLKWASYLSLFHINSYATDHIRLKLALWDTSCSNQMTTRTIADIFSNNIGAGIVGPSCGTQSITVNDFSPYFSMGNVGYSVESETLNSREKYSAFYRMSATADIYQRLWLAAMRKLGWKQASLVVQSDSTFQDVQDSVQVAAKADNISLDPITTIQSADDIDVDTLWARLMASRTRIITFISYHPIAQRIVCALYHKVTILIRTLSNTMVQQTS